MQKYTLLPTEDASAWSDRHSLVEDTSGAHGNSTGLSASRNHSSNSLSSRAHFSAPSPAIGGGSGSGIASYPSHSNVNSAYLTVPSASMSAKQVRGLERFTLAATALVHSKYYFIVYAVVVALCLTSLIWTVAQPYKQVLGILVLEIIINLILIVELGIRFTSLGAKRYFASWSNRFDFVVFLLCIAALITYIASSSGETEGEEIEEVGSLVLLIVRSALQIIRLIVLLRHQVKQYATHRPVDIMRIERPRTGSMSNMLDMSDDNMTANYLIDDEDEEGY